ncbi:MAG: RNA methyltransferase [Opitutaceae bacterium]|nr:RNA methyltransferase [Opitutaceae bacterium]
MANFSKPDPRPRGTGAAREFVAPAGQVRQRGEAAPYPAVERVAAKRPERSEPAATGEGLRGSRSGPARDELKLCGLAAVRARFAKDPDSILRLFFDEPTSRRVGIMSKVLAQAKKVYRCVPPAELEKIAGSVHHGGIVAVVKAPVLRTPTGDNLRSWAARRETVLVLDRIGNAHNLGALARTAAFFGVPRIVLAEDGSAAKPSDAAHRVAEGGLEHVEVWQTKDLVTLAKQLALAGYEVVGAATRGGRPEANRLAEKPVALVLGNEEHGLAPELARACTRLVTIPGVGAVESLNVSVAGAVLLWELVARRGRPASA